MIEGGRWRERKLRARSKWAWINVTTVKPHQRGRGRDGTASITVPGSIKPELPPACLLSPRPVGALHINDALTGRTRIPFCTRSFWDQITPPPSVDEMAGLVALGRAGSSGRGGSPSAVPEQYVRKESVKDGKMFQLSTDECMKGFQIYQMDILRTGQSDKTHNICKATNMKYFSNATTMRNHVS